MRGAGRKGWTRTSGAADYMREHEGGTVFAVRLSSRRWLWRYVGPARLAVLQSCSQGVTDLLGNVCAVVSARFAAARDVRNASKREVTA